MHEANNVNGTNNKTKCEHCQDLDEIIVIVINKAAVFKILSRNTSRDALDTY